jgi:hypothetical protein
MTAERGRADGVGAALRCFAMAFVGGRLEEGQRRLAIAGSLNRWASRRKEEGTSRHTKDEYTDQHRDDHAAWCGCCRLQQSHLFIKKFPVAPVHVVLLDTASQLVKLGPRLTVPLTELLATGADWPSVAALAFTTNKLMLVLRCIGSSQTKQCLR